MNKTDKKMPAANERFHADSFVGICKCITTRPNLCEAAATSSASGQQHSRTPTTEHEKKTNDVNNI